MYTLTSPICIPMTNWRSVNRRSALESFFNNPHTLASAVPLGFCCGGFSSTAGYAPATKLNFRRAASLPSAGPCLRVPLVSEWLEKVSQPSLAEPFGSNQGVDRINSRLSLLSLGRHRTDCRSLCRSQRPQPSRHELYTPMPFLDQTFARFIFEIA